MKNSEDVLMTGKEIMRTAVSERGLKQRELAERLGMLQTSLSMSLAREHISLELFSKILSGMGYAVAVIDKDDGEVRWVVDPDQ